MNWSGQLNSHQNRPSNKRSRKRIIWTVRTRIFGPPNLQIFLFVIALLSTYVNVNGQTTTPGAMVKTIIAAAAGGVAAMIILITIFVIWYAKCMIGSFIFPDSLNWGERIRLRLY